MGPACVFGADWLLTRGEIRNIPRCHASFIMKHRIQSLQTSKKGTATAAFTRTRDNTCARRHCPIDYCCMSPPHHIMSRLRKTLSCRLLYANINIISSYICFRDSRYIPGIQQYHSNASTRSSIYLGHRKQLLLRSFLLPGMCHSSNSWMFWGRAISFFTATLVSGASFRISLSMVRNC